MFVGRDDNVTLSQEREREIIITTERERYYNTEIVITTEREILQQMKKNCAVK